MPTYETWLPAWCSVRVRLETDEPIADDAELRKKMIEQGSTQSSLCHRCSDNMEFDGSFDWELAQNTIGDCTIERID